MTKLNRGKIYSLIHPIPLKLNAELKLDTVKFSPILDISGKDLGRSLLNHNKYHLTEYLTFFDEESDEESFEKLHSRVELSLADNIILTFSLMTYLKSKHNKQKGNWSLIVPSTSYAYPLLLTYHLVLQHLGEGLFPTLGVRFPQGSGILIVTDNIELHSHVWRTKIAKTLLRKFIDTYIVKRGKFSRFNLSQIEDRTEQNDGSLPWLCFYRAVRNELVEQLEKSPEIIIIDLLPFRHRDKAQQLIEWAKKHANHIIVISPLYDENVYRSIKEHFNYILPIDHCNLKKINNIFFKEDNYTQKNRVTASWSLKASELFLTPERPVFHIHTVSGIHKIDQKVNDVLSVLTRYQSTATRRLWGIVNEIINLIIPLDLYEQLLIADGKSSLLSRINACEKIIPENEYEKRIYQTVLPVVIREIRELYFIFKEHYGSPRGEAIFNIIKLNKEKRIIIITSNKRVVNEYKIWLRIKMGLTANDLKNVIVVSQDDWAINQLREVYFEENNNPEVLIVANLWKQKNLSSFVCSPNTQVHCIAIKHEAKLYRYQIEFINSCNSGYYNDFDNTFINLFNIQLPQTTMETNNKPNIISDRIYVSSITKNEKVPGNDNKSEKITDLLDDQVLLSMMSYESHEDQEVEDNKVIFDLQEFSKDNQSGDFIQSIKIKAKTDNVTRTFFLAHDSILKIVRYGQEEVIGVRPLELLVKDLWVKTKEKQKRELFESVLELASNTMVMKWIELNVSEWKEMIGLLWKKCHSQNSSIKDTCIKIMKLINENGGSVDSYATIYNWVRGEVTAVKDERNVKAVAYILSENEYVARWNIIFKAMRTLWNIHIKLGKILGKLITESAIRINTPCSNEEWIDLGMEIKLPIDDVLNALELLQIEYIDTESDYYVHERYLYMPLDEVEEELLIEKGWIRYEQLN